MKHLLTLVATATLSTALVQADSQGRMNRSAMSSQNQKPARPVDDKYGPNLRQGFFLSADFLYWIAHQEGLEYATTGVFGALNSADNIPVAAGSAKKVNFKWKPGFRVGLGWTLPNSYWDLSANWTWYHSTARGSASHTGDANLNSLFPVMLQPALADFGGTVLSQASAKWRLCYNTVDVELGRSFYPNKHLSLRAHAGVRGAWVNQHFSTLYTFTTTPNSISQKYRNNYRAAGFKTGVDTLWSFNRYWGIFANNSVSLLGGNFHAHEVDFANVPATPLIGNMINVSDRIFSVVPVLETAMGFHLTLGPANRHYWFDLNAGWEYLIWFNQNQNRFFSDDLIRGLFIRERANLHLMGFTLNAKLHF